MLSRVKKEGIVTDIKDGLENARAVFLTNLIGVSANDSVSIRKKVRDGGGKIVVTRNTLFKRAAQGSFAESLFDGIKGPHAVAFAFDDAPAIAKALYEAGKENEVIELKGGFLGEKSLTAAEIKQLAMLPSRDEMLGTLLATFNAPISALARVLFSIQEQKQEASGETVEAKAEEVTEEPAKEEAVAEESAPAASEEKTEE